MILVGLLPPSQISPKANNNNIGNKRNTRYEQTENDVTPAIILFHKHELDRYLQTTTSQDTDSENLLHSFPQPSEEDHRHVQAMLGTAVISASLRLRHEGGEGRVTGGCEPQAAYA